MKRDGSLSPRKVIVVGIPTRNEASTVQDVVQVVAEGVRQAGLSDRSMIINADNGSTDGTPDSFWSVSCDVPRMSIATGSAGTGKGTNVMAIFHAALDLDAERVLLLDADVRSAEPGWIRAMLDAVTYEEPVMATPIYRRNRFEGNTTNHLVSPLLAGTLATWVQQPIAGDFAFNQALIRRAVSWPLPESAQFYGIDVHLTANTARERLRIVGVPLGRKIHNPGFPKILHMSQQVIDSLMHVMGRSGRPMPISGSPARQRSTVDDVAAEPDTALVQRTFARVALYLSRCAGSIADLFPSSVQAPRLEDGFLVFDSQSWAEILADAVSAVSAGRAEQARDHLVALYLCRVRSYWKQIQVLRSPDAIDAELDAQSQATIAAIASRPGLNGAVAPPMQFTAGFWAAGSV